MTEQDNTKTQDEINQEILNALICVLDSTTNCLFMGIRTELDDKKMNKKYISMENARWMAYDKINGTYSVGGTVNSASHPDGISSFSYRSISKIYQPNDDLIQTYLADITGQETKVFYQPTIKLQ